MKNVKIKKIAFLDRDGVINVSAAKHEYITSVDGFVFIPKVFDLLKTLARDGFEFIVITNQQGVGRGKMTISSLHTIHDHMRKGFKEQGITILDVFYCPHLDGTCDCRKPNDGMLHQAAAKYAIDVSSSILIGDNTTDIEAGKKFGLSQTILVTTDHPEEALNTYTPAKIKIAFVKYGGMTAGGSEKMLQIIAANLDKEKFIVDYYYCDNSPFLGSKYQHSQTDPNRLEYARKHGINLIKFSVGAVDDVHPYHIWRETDFWDKFTDTKYDIIQTVRAGHPEYPFTKIRHTPIAEIIALSAGTDNQYNISRSMHICQWSADTWIRSGGDKKRIEIVSLPIEIADQEYGSLRNELDLESKFIFGMHQRVSDNIFSDIPLSAYSQIENEGTAFIMLGGSELYRKQAAALGIKSIHFLPATGNSDTIFKFLNTLDVYAHGRKDGEVNSQAMAEAMFFGTPIVSHLSAVNNGHVECIGNGGKVLANVTEYAEELKRLQTDTYYFTQQSKNARKRFDDNYELTKQIKKFENIYRDIKNNPYPYPIRRIIFSLYWTQNIRIPIKWLYRYIRYKHLNKYL